ncbi:hypothetical protein BN946_scf184978.g26 [Trametes cinnabarina]|uniref:Uncharacterized protein n=1 Tax=Pycnoporus cinnabarinus TaxID=5643 RepID=A0A060SQL5_PYCCI|nr:hypothetical protein BN946_scf184978.g26 [Trametes cinnabarina]
MSRLNFWGRAGSPEEHPERLQNRGVPTASVRFINPDAVQSLCLGFNSHGAALHGGQKRGSGGDCELGPHTDLDALVDEIWAQFAFDLVQVSPNLRDIRDPPYITLSSDQRDKVTIDLYKQHALPFLSVYYRTRTHEFWCESFDKYFPPDGKPVDKAQNYPACRYYQTWLRMQKWTTRSRFESIRVKLKPLFMKLLWLPYNELDRIWNTRKPLQTVHAWTHLSSRSWGSLGSGVRILVNETRLLRSRQKMYLGNREPPTREAKDSDEKDAVELEKEPVKDEEVRPLTRVASRFERVSVRTSPEGPTARHTNGARVDGPRNREPAAEASVGHDQPRTKRPSEFLSQESPATKRRRLDESGGPSASSRAVAQPGTGTTRMYLRLSDFPPAGGSSRPSGLSRDNNKGQARPGARRHAPDA